MDNVEMDPQDPNLKDMVEADPKMNAFIAKFVNRAEQVSRQLEHVKDIKYTKEEIYRRQYNFLEQLRGMIDMYAFFHTRYGDIAKGIYHNSKEDIEKNSLSANVLKPLIKTYWNLYNYGFLEFKCALEDHRQFPIHELIYDFCPELIKTHRDIRNLEHLMTMSPKKVTADDLYKMFNIDQSPVSYYNKGILDMLSESIIDGRAPII